MNKFEENDIILVKPNILCDRNGSYCLKSPSIMKIMSIIQNSQYKVRILTILEDPHGKINKGGVCNYDQDYIDKASIKLGGLMEVLYG